MFTEYSSCCHYKILLRNPVGKWLFGEGGKKEEKKKGDVKIKLRWIIGKCVVMTGSG
jgi:hypothetical protein